ncbi:MAG TPA: DinB family protein [Candidatus Acidoferrales bacterium]|nr:DinB family protein [Candidatus Acidoferrales bacterium]
MKRQALVLMGTFALASASLLAQAPAGAGTPAQSSAAAPSTADAIRQSYNVVKNNLLKAADKMPDDAYDFKPTPEQRSFGGWVAHVADAQTAGCSRVTGNPTGGGAASKTSKADLVAALKDSFQICDAAYAGLTDSNSGDVVQSFRGATTRLASLAGNAGHDNECYGAMAVYMRLKGIVPPSSEPRTR